jgi:hypothetical protein
MPDIRQLHDLADQVHPPSLDALRAVSSARRRRGAVVAAGGLAGLLVIVAAVLTGLDRSDRTGPVPAPRPTRSIPTTGTDAIETTRPDGVSVLAPDPESGSVSLDGGRYAVHLSGSTLAEVDVPAGWEATDGAFIHPNPASARKGMWFVAGGQDEPAFVPSDPCHDQSFRSVGPSVSDLAVALTRLPFFETSGPTPTTVGGHEAQFVELRIPAEADPSACQRGRVAAYRSGHGDGGTWLAAPEGAVIELWVLEVHGTRYTIHAQWAESAKDLVVLREMVESTTFSRSDEPSGK